MTDISRIKLRLKILHNKLIPSGPSSNRIHLILLLLLLILFWLLTQAVKIHAANPDRPEQGIANEIIRFHVIANSDSDDDQQLKYRVKDALVQYLQPYLKVAKDKEKAQGILTDMLPLIEDATARVIKENGYNYSVTASLSTSYFPIRVYGDYVFPPGQYEALRIQIGQARGKNWWCVMFPPLCFVDDTYGIVGEDGKEKLEYLLTEEEFEILRNRKIPVKVRFKIFESIKKLFTKD